MQAKTHTINQQGRPDWEITVECHGTTFEITRSAAVMALECVKLAKSVKDIDGIGGGGGGSDGHSGSYGVRVKSPLKDRIARLRQEADELEAQLNGSPPP